jgi:glutamate racemase
LKLNPQAQVFQQACPLFVPLAEEGWVDDPITNLIVFRYVSEVLRNGIDSLIMGCTHYPILRQSIAKAAGPAVELIDSSRGLIEDLTPHLGPPTSPATADRGRLAILCTDYSPRLEETIRFILGPTPVDALEVVDI